MKLIYFGQYSFVVVVAIIITIMIMGYLVLACMGPGQQATPGCNTARGCLCAACYTKRMSKRPRAVTSLCLGVVDAVFRKLPKFTPCSVRAS
eukprot:jgi/Mesvir1/2983/Mv26554-RA.1